MVGVYSIVIKNNVVFKTLNKNNSNEVAQKLLKLLKHKKKLKIYQRIIENAYLRPIIGIHIVNGKIISGVNYISPYINGLLLSDKESLINLHVQQKLNLIDSIKILINNIKSISINREYIDGDWTLHNLIWDYNKIINIDLEGFFTYSKNGPQLSWENYENKVSSIILRLRKIIGFINNYKDKKDIITC